MAGLFSCSTLLLKARLWKQPFPASILRMSAWFPVVILYCATSLLVFLDWSCKHPQVIVSLICCMAFLIQVYMHLSGWWATILCGLAWDVTFPLGSKLVISVNSIKLWNATTLRSSRFPFLMSPSVIYPCRSSGPSSLFLLPYSPFHCWQVHPLARDHPNVHHYGWGLCRCSPLPLGVPIWGPPPHHQRLGHLVYIRPLELSGCHPRSWPSPDVVLSPEEQWGGGASALFAEGVPLDLHHLPF